MTTIGIVPDFINEFFRTSEKNQYKPLPDEWEILIKVHIQELVSSCELSGSCHPGLDPGSICLLRKDAGPWIADQVRNDTAQNEQFF
ncbi:MAG: hypothetical protein V4542_12180 [Pseudomonadota bacterium]